MKYQIDGVPVELGVIEFHTSENNDLIDDFYNAVDHARASGCIVDLWLMDIAEVLRRHGYEMLIFHREKAKQDNDQPT